MRYVLYGLHGRKLHVEMHPLNKLDEFDDIGAAIRDADTRARQCIAHRTEAFVFSVHDTERPNGEQAVYTTGQGFAFWPSLPSGQPAVIDRT